MYTLKKHNICIQQNILCTYIYIKYLNKSEMAMTGLYYPWYGKDLNYQMLKTQRDLMLTLLFFLCHLLIIMLAN